MCAACFPQRLQGEAEVSCTEERLGSRCATLAALCENNMDCQLSLEECRAKLSRRYNTVIEPFTPRHSPHSQCTAAACLSVCFPPLSDAAVKQMREETKHMLREIIHNDERAKKAMQEMTRVGARHRATVAKLREKEELTSARAHRAGVSGGTCCPYELLLFFPSWLFECLCCSTGADGETEEGSEESGGGLGRAQG